MAGLKTYTDSLSHPFNPRYAPTNNQVPTKNSQFVMPKGAQKPSYFTHKKHKLGMAKAIFDRDDQPSIGANPQSQAFGGGGKVGIQAQGGRRLQRTAKVQRFQPEGVSGAINQGNFQGTKLKRKCGKKHKHGKGC